MSRLGQILNIKQGEGRMVSLMIGIMLFTAAGWTLGSTGIETLFIKRFGVQYLPFMFLGLGVTNMITSFGITAFLARVPRTLLYITLPMFMVIVLVGGRIALTSEIRWLYPLLWLAKEVFNSLTALLVWGIAGFVSDARQAKRLFPLFNASRILGEVVGGLSLGVFVKFIGTENVLIVWAVVLFIAFGLILALLRNANVTKFFTKKTHRKPPSVMMEIRHGFNYVRNSRLLVMVAYAAILFSVLYFSISMPFSRLSSEKFANEKDLATFLGLFQGVATASAFLVSLLLTNRFFARFGIMAALLILPLIYLGGFTSMVVAPIFVVVVIFRLTQIIWLSGMADPAYQAMFNIIPVEQRDQVRSFIDGFPGQAGTFIAGGLLIVGDQFLTAQQLAMVGFFAAVLCFITIMKARRGYNDALMDALRSGRSQMFDEKTIGSFNNDIKSLTRLLRAINDPDPILRRVAVEILTQIPNSGVATLLVNALRDSDIQVRVAALQGLTKYGASSALLEIAASLSDPEPEVRSQAVSSLYALAGFPHGKLFYLRPLLNDPDPQVSSQAAVALLKLPVETSEEQAVREQARAFLRETAVMGEMGARVAALTSLGESKDSEFFEFLSNEMQERNQSFEILRAILRSMVQISPTRAIPYVIETFTHSDSRVVSMAAKLAGEIGDAIMPQAVALLKTPEYELGALITLMHLPAPPPMAPIEEYVRMSVDRAEHRENQMRQIKAQVQNDAGKFLADVLHAQSFEFAIRALQAVSLLENREAMSLAIETLRSQNASQYAIGLEVIDELDEKWRRIVHPLLSLWDDMGEKIIVDEQIWHTLLSDKDEWVRACAAYTLRKYPDHTVTAELDKLALSDRSSLVQEAAKSQGDLMDTLTSLTLMDRIFFFKKIPLFEKLSPTDLKQVAMIAEESMFTDGETFAEEGEHGDVMYVIVSGKVKVATADANEKTEVVLAERGVGDYVGEMSLINSEPRIASLTAIGTVRTLCLNQKSFLDLLRERPDVGMALIRVLSLRLKEANELIEKISPKTPTFIKKRTS